VFFLLSLNPIQWLRDLYALCEQWVMGPYSIWALLGVGFAESSFFPIPPDPLLLLWGANESHHEQVILVAILVGLISCVGGMFGYWIGYVGGRPLLDWMCTKPWLGWLMNSQRLATVEGAFKKWGMLAIVIAALTPIPYKVFTIAAGAARMNFRQFVLGSLVGRMPRFIAEGLFLYYCGPLVREEFAQRGEYWFSALGLLVVIGFLMMARIKHKPPDADLRVIAPESTPAPEPPPAP
jgi:undecaprenyl-diphosphatase